MKDQIHAWIYCQIDAPEDEHGMLKGQKKELYDYADQMGFIVVGCSEDLGNTMDRNRSGLIVALKAAEQEKIDVLLVKNLSRLGRSMVQNLKIIQKLKQSNVKLYSPLEGEIGLEQSMTPFR